MAMPNRKASAREPSGASRATLLNTLSGMPGCRPASIVAFTRPIAGRTPATLKALAESLAESLPGTAVAVAVAAEHAP